MHSISRLVTIAALGVFTAAQAAPLASLDEATLRRIDGLVDASLKSGAVPSASIAVVLDGRIVLRKAYGKAAIEPARIASPGMRYAIGSNSKEFLAAALLMLESEGRLGLDDKVSQYLPGLGAVGAASIRQLLNHTAGVRDYWPQDYVFADMRSPTTSSAIAARWAQKPLDFAPGERWQYSNTGYVLAGMILEKVAGEPLFRFLDRRIFQPLGMHSAVDFDRAGPAAGDAAGYTSYALGPLEPAPTTGPGWLFAAAELAMNAEDLARWDISIIDQSLLSAGAYRALERETLLNEGAGTRYALGLEVRLKNGHRMLAHGGEVSGFVSRNVIYPDSRLAVVVLTNSDAADAAESIADKLGDLLIASEDADDAKRALAEDIFKDLQEGRIQRALFSENGNAYFTDAALKNAQQALHTMGELQSFELLQTGIRGGMDYRVYELKLARGALTLVTRTWLGGSIEQYLLIPE